MQKIMLGIKPASITRFANSKRDMRIKTSGIDVSRFMTGFSLDVDQYTKAVVELQNNNNLSVDDIKKYINSNINFDYDLMQLTNGHDFFQALGHCLRETLAN